MPKYKTVSIMERKTKKRRGKPQRNVGRKNKLGKKESRDGKKIDKKPYLV